MRINKTINNLEKIWKQLDEADGLLNNAIFTLMSMKNFDQEMQDKIERTSDSFDQIVNLKNDIEKLIEEKKNQKNVKNEWHLEHAEFDCDKCKINDTTYSVELYLGTYKGKEAMKYKCTNSECDYEEIKSYDEMYEEEYSNKLD